MAFPGEGEIFRKRAQARRGPRESTKILSLPWRTSREEYDRDMELLTEIPNNISVADFEMQVIEIKKRREAEITQCREEELTQRRPEEVEGLDSSAPKRAKHASPAHKRAKIKRAGHTFNLPHRASLDELRRDEELLATLPERYASGKTICLRDVSRMFELVKGHRAREIAKGSQQELCLGDEASFSLYHRTSKKRKLEETKVTTSTGVR